ncbi:hypothetical protein [Streptomyces sp. NPDC058855]|uniref:hypothetical protein n=1 Tax=Streptomyces sp. NPDC058855 TaxID=3346651 RepID=UPI00369708C7
MTTSEATGTPRAPGTAAARPGGPRLRWPAVSPAVPAAVFVLVQLALVVPGSGLGWDEAVYVSQVGGNAPPAYFSAPRARGISYLVAPVAAVTASTTAIRVYLAVLSGAALWAALRVWRGILPAPVLTAAGALFAGLWVTLFYGPRVMPNLWCAFGALAAVGCFLRATGGVAATGTAAAGAEPPGTARPGVRTAVGSRAALWGLGAAVAAVTLLRPADGFWLAVPLLAVALAAPAVRRRHRAVAAVVVVAPLLGALPWIAEAYARYGGLAARLRRAGEIQGSLGWNLAVDDHVRALAGRTLCRPCDVPWEHPVTAVWWFLLPLAVLGGVVAALRADPAGRGAAAVLATVTAASLAAPYLFTLGYAAPRFLLPAYALLALPAAECALFLLTALRPAWRPAATALLAAALLAHLAVQYAVLARAVTNSRSVRAQFTTVATALHGLGVRPPCLVSGREYVLIGYYAGCVSRQPAGHDASITPAGLTAAARRVPVAVVVPAGSPPPSYARAWRLAPLPSARGWERYDAYVSPATARDGARRP